MTQYTIGDVVLVKVNKKWVRATIVEAHGEQPYQHVVIQRHGLNPDTGRRWNKVSRMGVYVKPSPAGDPLSANVYADWLEEHGEEKAARMLREAFPISAAAAKTEA